MATDPGDEIAISIHTDPALAVTARMFVVAAARHFLGADADVEDLRLVASELFTNGVETASPSIEIRLARRDGQLVLRATGVGSLTETPIEVDAPRSLRRIDLLRGVFPATTLEDDGAVVIAVPIEPSADG